MTVSIWWVLWAFIAGGYAGALVVGLMSMTSGRGEVRDRRRTDRSAQRFAESNPRRHAGAEMYGSV